MKTEGIHCHSDVDILTTAIYTEVLLSLTTVFIVLMSSAVTLMY